MCVSGVRQINRAFNEPRVCRDASFRDAKKSDIKI